MTNKSLDSYSSGERSTYGVIATIVNTKTGDTRTLNFAHGTTVEAAREVAERCDEMGPEWKVRTISHPLTILRDLKGRNEGPKAHPPELILFGRIGRKDLLEPLPAYYGLRTWHTNSRKRGEAA